jgi:hypothetical protein
LDPYIAIYLRRDVGDFYLFGIYVRYILMTYLRNSILATLAYYDIFDYPLTLIEVHKFLVNPSRLMNIGGAIGTMGLAEIYGELDKLIASGIVNEKNGFYFLGSRPELYSQRIENSKIADQKWKKFLKAVKFLALAPFLRGVFASGSMALGNTEQSSDFDVLVIARTGRLYTCRFFLWLISSLLGVRRKKYQKVAPDKLCFNHHITDSHLYLRHQSLFNAQTYINLKPAMISPALIDKFFAENFWLNKYAYNFRVQKNFVRRSVKPPLVFKISAKTLELILLSPLGDALESLLKSLQQKRIKEDPVTYEPGGRIVFNNDELEFHPHSFEKYVIDKYNSNLIKLGVVPLNKEKDSGLQIGPVKDINI